MKIIDIHSHKIDEVRNDTIYNLLYPANNQLNDNLYYSIGIHPWYIPDTINWADFISIAQKENVLAIGEVGLDKIKGKPIDTQYSIFMKQALIAEDIGKPIIIHMVKTQAYILKAYKEVKPKQPWIVHGFRGNNTQAEQLLKHNISISIGEKFNNTLKEVDKKHLFIETDNSDVSIESILKNFSGKIQIDEKKIERDILTNTRRIFI